MASERERRVPNKPRACLGEEAVGKGHTLTKEGRGHLYLLDYPYCGEEVGRRPTLEWRECKWVVARTVGGGKGRVWGSVWDCVQVSGRSLDTSKLNVDPWVQLVLVGVDTNRQIDPIRKAMMADRPGRLTRLSCSHLYSLELSLQQPCQQADSEECSGAWNRLGLSPQSVLATLAAPVEAYAAAGSI